MYYQLSRCVSLFVQGSSYRTAYSIGASLLMRTSCQSRNWFCSFCRFQVINLSFLYSHVRSFPVRNLSFISQRCRLKLSYYIPTVHFLYWFITSECLFLISLRALTIHSHLVLFFIIPWKSMTGFNFHISTPFFSQLPSTMSHESTF